MGGRRTLDEYTAWMKQRYQERPFLRFIDFYVLWSIGHLDVAQAEALERMERKLREIFGEDGPWQIIVARQMDFPDTLPSTIRSIWENGSAKARKQNWTPDPLEFMRQFVDINFPP